MLAALKSKQFAYVLAALAFAISFFMWQGMREKTKQLKEKTAQLKHIMENPIVKTVSGPTKIIKGKTIVKEVIIKPDGTRVEREEINEPEITERGEVRTETDYKDPIGEAEAKKRKFMVFGGYSFDERISFGMGMTLFNRLNLGTLLVYNNKDNNIAPGLQIAVLF